MVLSWYAQLLTTILKINNFRDLNDKIVVSWIGGLSIINQKDKSSIQLTITAE